MELVQLPLAARNHGASSSLPGARRLWRSPLEAGAGLRHARSRSVREDVRLEGLEFVELTTAVSNVASCKVIEANGGVLIERLRLGPEYGGIEDFRFRIYLGPIA